MTAQRPSRIGTCPQCETAIAAHDVLIAYEREDGIARYAECPECHEVVKPT
jgi:hypothetical protein